jgi:hypothetical protein
MHKRRMLAMGELSGRAKGGIARAAKLLLRLGEI